MSMWGGNAADVNVIGIEEYYDHTDDEGRFRFHISPHAKRGRTQAAGHWLEPWEVSPDQSAALHACATANNLLDYEGKCPNRCSGVGQKERKERMERTSNPFVRWEDVKSIGKKAVARRKCTNTLRKRRVPPPPGPLVAELESADEEEEEESEPDDVEDAESEYEDDDNASEPEAQFTPPVTPLSESPVAPPVAEPLPLVSPPAPPPSPNPRVRPATASWRRAPALVIPIVALQRVETASTESTLLSPASDSGLFSPLPLPRVTQGSFTTAFDSYLRNTAPTPPEDAVDMAKRLAAERRAAGTDAPMLYPHETTEERKQRQRMGVARAMAHRA